MDLRQEIERLKEQRDAVILAHYYVAPEVQDVADYVGDSYFLSKKAVDLPQKTLVFCGVAFMGESARILNPEKVVLMPAADADCPMAHMGDEEVIRRAREEYDDLAVVCYINSTAQLKSLCDVCITSSNAVDIVRALPQKNILLVPDQNLARYVAQQVPEKHILLPEGYCPIHHEIEAGEVRRLKEEHPEALVLVHPECRPEVTAQADYIGSTAGILQYAACCGAKKCIICTEEGVRHPLELANPDKEFYFPQPTPICPDMKKITLEQIRDVLERGCNAVELPGQLAQEARHSLDTMLNLAR